MSICLERVSFSYGDTVVLQDVTLHLPENGVVCLWGPSGCGKTTLLRLLAMLEKPDSGSILQLPENAADLCDEPLRQQTDIGRRTKCVSMVFQEDRLLPWLTALQNVTVVGTEEEAAQKILRTLGFAEEEMHALPANLSGGQQRRVALARALAADSVCLLLDEPFNGLDENTWQNVVPLITTYAEHKPVVLVTHIREQAEALSARFVPLKGVPLSGELMMGNLEEILS